MRYWAVARYDLGLTSEEFFDCTPRQIDALIQRYERGIQVDEFMTAQHIACTVNFSMARPKEPVQPKDFMPSQWAKAGRDKVKNSQARQQMIATQIRGVMASMPGGIIKKNG